LSRPPEEAVRVAALDTPERIAKKGRAGNGAAPNQAVSVVEARLSLD
jgi:hypothetical protein